jgi:hypothetical protein
VRHDARSRGEVKRGGAGAVWLQGRWHGKDNDGLARHNPGWVGDKGAG